MFFCSPIASTQNSLSRAATRLLRPNLQTKSSCSIVGFAPGLPENESELNFFKTILLAENTVPI